MAASDTSSVRRYERDQIRRVYGRLTERQLGLVAGPSVFAYSNATRPAATNFTRGTTIFNTDDNAPNVSDGTNWRDEMGNLT